jgi:hypothetical protein
MNPAPPVTRTDLVFSPMILVNLAVLAFNLIVNAVTDLA